MHDGHDNSSRMQHRKGRTTSKSAAALREEGSGRGGLKSPSQRLAPVGEFKYLSGRRRWPDEPRYSK